MTNKYKGKEKRDTTDRVKIAVKDFVRSTVVKEGCDFTMGFAAMLEATVEIGVACYGRQGTIAHFQTLAIELPDMLRASRN